MLRARLGDGSDHGGVLISASPNVFVNGIPCCRVTDLHACPIEGHGITPIVSGSSTVTANNLSVAYIGSTVGCGATIISASPNVDAGG